MGTIRKRGDKWSYRVDLGAVNGKRMQKEKGGFATKKEAAAAMTLVENELLKTGEYVEAEQKITMQQLYEEFIEEEAPLTRKYILNHSAIIQPMHTLNELAIFLLVTHSSPP